MPPRGRKPTPTKFKLLRGNPGKRPIREDEPELTVGLPEPPPYLDEVARTEWFRIGPELAQAGVMTTADVTAFAAYCESWSRYRRSMDQVNATDEILKAKSGYPMVNPYLSVATKALQACQSFWAEFGMTPSSRTRVGSTAPKSKSVDKRKAEYL